MTTQAPTNTDLAVTRTRLAHDRTLIAWVRTATSLISFGFTIYKFSQYLQGERLHDEAVNTPRPFAILMIAIGLISLAIATAQHSRDMILLRKQFANVPYSFATLLAALISLLGTAALLAVIFRQ